MKTRKQLSQEREQIGIEQVLNANIKSHNNNDAIKQMPNRIPRPTGTTELSNIYNKTNNIEDLHQLQSHVINHYINTNFQYCNRPMNIETFSTYIKVDVSQIHNTMHNTSKVLYNQLTNEGQENISGAIMTMLFGLP